MEQLRDTCKEILVCLPDGETKDGLAQMILDYAIGCDMSGLLSERLTTQYMCDHIGGLEGPKPGDYAMLEQVEAYNINLSNNQYFVVDRRSIYNPNQDAYSYNAEQDTKLIEAAFQNWFKSLLLETRVPGSDKSVVERMVNNHLKLRFGIGSCLKYGLLHGCREFPSLYVPSSESNQVPKTMYCEYYAKCLNLPSQSRFPYHHLWEHEELRFEVRAMTYSSKPYLTVHMPVIHE